jgi:hypothetical protein
MQPLIQFKRTTSLLLIPLLLACFGLSPIAQAVVPAPDGGYPSGNTAEGAQALFSLTTGGANTAIGFQALFRNTTGVDNAATGWRALFHNTAGVANTANGPAALYSNTTGDANTANGYSALFSNTTGGANTANGYYALALNTTGVQNTADGQGALFSNTTGNRNTVNGQAALLYNTTGDDNTANGVHALFNNTTGDDNIALGFEAGQNLTTGDDNIDIGNDGVAAESDTIRVGTQGTQTNAYIAGIFGATVANGVTVIVDPTGHLGTIASSQRFKDEIKPMDKASEAILALKPVTFRYKQEFDPKGVPQFGLVAEEVEKVNPALVARDAKGEVHTVRYEAVNAMLLNEFLKEHRKNEEQQANIERQQKQIEALAAIVKEQAAQIQEVSAQLELAKDAPQTVVNHQ